MKKVISIIICLCLVLTQVSAQNTFTRLDTIKQVFLHSDTNIVMIAAHRGAHLKAPENSLKSFTNAIALGIDIIELDIRCTKDNKLVIMHDRTVDRTTNGKGEVSQLTLQEIKQLKLKHNGAVTTETVPTLEEALLHVKGEILVDLDIKSSECINDIIRTVEATNTKDQCIFFVGSTEHLKMLYQYDPTIKVLARSHNIKEIESYFTIAKVAAIHIDDNHHTKHVVDFITQNNGRTWVNALGDTDKEVEKGNINAFGNILKFGANIIQTDQPELLKKYLLSINRYH